MNNSGNLLFDDRKIISLRGVKNQVDPLLPYAFLVEKERSILGEIEDVATIFLSNSECPFKCLMCDLWKNTTNQPVKKGDIPRQIQEALSQLPSVSHIKLYNSGNFFDNKAIPPDDYLQIVRLLRGYRSVTVECHPKLIDQCCLEFSNMLDADLEVAIGLETVHPDILPLLNKRMTLTDFERSVKFLKEHSIRTRAFILLRTPFMTEEDGVKWAKKSIDFAFKCGIDCCSIIPTRSGNGALDYLKEQGFFKEPSIFSLEKVLDYGIGLNLGRVFADLWDVERFSTCEKCLAERKERLKRMNLMQQVLPEIVCRCGN